MTGLADRAGRRVLVVGASAGIGRAAAGGHGRGDARFTCAVVGTTQPSDRGATLTPDEMILRSPSPVAGAEWSPGPPARPKNGPA